MSHLFLDGVVAVTASALMALMVAVGASAIADLPTDVNVQTEGAKATDPEPRIVCWLEGERTRCIREET